MQTEEDMLKYSQKKDLGIRFFGFVFLGMSTLFLFVLIYVVIFGDKIEDIIFMIVILAIAASITYLFACLPNKINIYEKKMTLLIRRPLKMILKRDNICVEYSNIKKVDILKNSYRNRTINIVLHIEGSEKELLMFLWDEEELSMKYEEILREKLGDNKIEITITDDSP